MSVANKHFSPKIIQEGNSKKPIIILVKGFLSKNDNEYNTQLEVLKQLGYTHNEIWEIKWDSKCNIDALPQYLITKINPILGLKNLYKIIKGCKNIIENLFIKKRDHKEVIQKELVTSLVPTLPVVGDVTTTGLDLWKKAVGNTNKTGEKLATFLEERKGQKFILIGHSLGARIIVKALSYLNKYRQQNISNNIKKIKRKKSVIKNVYLLGAAISVDDPSWRGINNVVSGKIYNWYSKNDDVLSKIYVIGQYKYHHEYENFPAGSYKVDKLKVKNKKCEFTHLEYLDNLDKCIKEANLVHKIKNTILLCLSYIAK